MPYFGLHLGEPIGEVTASNAIRTGVLAWEKPYQLLFFEYFISGYSNSAIGRLIVGPASGLSETATLFCASHRTTATTTTSVSIPGWPCFGGAADNVRRHGTVWVTNNPSSVKIMECIGQNAGTAPTTAPTQYQMSGMWNNTTASIQRAELASYGAITGTAISGITFNSGTYLRAWGLNL